MLCWFVFRNLLRREREAALEVAGHEFGRIARPRRSEPAKAWVHALDPLGQGIASQLLNARLGVDVFVDRFADVLEGEVVRVMLEGGFRSRRRFPRCRRMCKR